MVDDRARERVARANASDGVARAIVAAKPTAYGLNLPAGGGAARAAANAGGRPSAAALGFGDDSASDDDDDDPVRARERANAEVRRQQEHLRARAARDASAAASAASAALAEDANAFEYDAVYDEIEAGRGKVARDVREERVERKSRYIEDLIKKAEARKKENDASYERRLLKERLKEDHLYADKDKFITAAYRAKLQEDAKWLAIEKARDAIEEEEDVTRRGSGAMTSFYSNLHRNAAFGGEDAPKTSSTAEQKSQPQLTSAAERDRVIIARAEAEAAAAPLPPIPEGATLVERNSEKPPPPSMEEASAPPKVDASAKKTSESDIADARARYLERKRKAAAAAGG